MSALCLLGPHGGQQPCRLAISPLLVWGFRDVKRQCLLKPRDPDFPQGPVWEGSGEGENRGELGLGRRKLGRLPRGGQARVTGHQGRFLARLLLTETKPGPSCPCRLKCLAPLQTGEGCAASHGEGRVGLAFPGLFLRCRGPSVPAEALTRPGAFSCFLGRWASVRGRSTSRWPICPRRWCPESGSRA